MRKITPEFEKIQIKILHGRVVKCVIDGVEGQCIGRSNRHVFLFGKKFVVKFDSDTKPVTEWGGRNVKVQNQREIDNYKLVNEEDRKYFAAILRTGTVRGRLYVVQEYVPTTRRAYKKEQDEYNAIRRKYSLTDVGMDFYGKYHHNVAVNKNGFKFYDLGWERGMEKKYEIQQPLF